MLPDKVTFQVNMIHGCLLSIIKKYELYYNSKVYVVFVQECLHTNSLTTNDASMRHDPCELSISLWEFIWSIKY